MTLRRLREIRKQNLEVRPRANQGRAGTTAELNQSRQLQVLLAMQDSLPPLMGLHEMARSDQTASRPHVQIPQLLARRIRSPPSLFQVPQEAAVTVAAVMTNSTADSIVHPRPGLLGRDLQATAVVQGHQREIHATNTALLEHTETSAKTLERHRATLVSLGMRCVVLDDVSLWVHSKCPAHSL